MNAIQRYLRSFPRVELAHTPTPVELMSRLSDDCKTSVYVKRDDCTGLAMGGNKARQLEYYLGEAVKRGCDSILSTGAVQSNYMRMLAAAAAKFGLECHIQLESRVDKKDEEYLKSGNVLLDKLLGAQLHHYAQGEDESGADARLEMIAEDLKEAGRNPYVIPLGPGHFPTGALGYMYAADELTGQLERLNIKADLIVVGSGSGMTHAGLLFGLRLIDDHTPVLGVCVRRDAVSQRSRIEQHCLRLAEHHGQLRLISDADIWLQDRMLAPGYGLASKTVLDTITRIARQEGVLLDPVYSGKTFACFLTMLGGGELADFDNVVVIHTGGAPAIFSYRKVLEQAILGGVE